MSWLVIKNDGIGDLILVSGIISEIARLTGEKVDLLTCAANREIADMISGIDNRLYVSRDGAAFRLTEDNATFYQEPEDVAVLRHLSRKKYSGAICLRRFIRLSSFRYMQAVTADHKICCWQFPTNANTEEVAWGSRDWRHITVPGEINHETNYYEYVLKTAFNTIDIDGSPFLTNCRPRKRRQKLDSVGLIIGGASCAPPVDFFGELIGQLTKSGLRTAIFGGNSEREREYATILARHYPDLEDHTGKLDLADSYGILNDYAVIIGNDTGLTHFASVFHPKVIVIAGGGTYHHFFPWPHRKNQLTVRYSLPCFSCNWNCTYRRCLNHLDPTKVFELIDDFYNGDSHQTEIDLNPYSASSRAAIHVPQSGRNGYEFNLPIYTDDVLRTPHDVVAAFANSESINALATKSCHSDALAPNINIVAVIDDEKECDITGLPQNWDYGFISGSQLSLTWYRNFLAVYKDKTVVPVDFLLNSICDPEFLPFVNRILADNRFPDSLYNHSATCQTRRNHVDSQLIFDAFIGQLMRDNPTHAVRIITDCPRAAIRPQFVGLGSNPLAFCCSQEFSAQLGSRTRPTGPGIGDTPEIVIITGISRTDDSAAILRLLSRYGDPRWTLVYREQPGHWSRTHDRQLWMDYLHTCGRTKFVFAADNQFWGIAYTHRNRIPSPGQLQRPYRVGTRQLLRQGVDNVYRQLGRITSHRIAVYGAGMHTRRLLQETRFTPHTITCILDDNANGSAAFGDIPCLAPKDLAKHPIDVILISSDTLETKLLENARKFAPDTVAIVPMYAVI